MIAEWLPEIVAFLATPFLIVCAYAFAVSSLRGPMSSGVFAAITAVAFIAVLTVARPLSPATIYLGHIPGFQEGVGIFALGAAAIVLYARGRNTDGITLGLRDFFLATAACLVVILLLVAGLLLMASMNPD